MYFITKLSNENYINTKNSTKDHLFNFWRLPKVSKLSTSKNIVND